MSSLFPEPVNLKPILFSTPMVQAIIEGRKTHTRRIIKPQPILEDGFWKLFGAGWSAGMASAPVMYGHSLYNKAPFKPGDILYVRETWGEYWGEYLYRADPKEKTDWWINGSTEGAWKPSIHMPREAARLFLRVTNVRVERLNEISSSDCESEGIVWNPGVEWTCEPGIDNAYLALFKQLWESINGPESWDANPWVWVYEFERCEKPIN